MEFRSIREISETLGIPKSRVKTCLSLYPVTETRCPGCGVNVKQTGYGRMQVFCDFQCYSRWFQKNILSDDSGLVHTLPSSEISRPEKLVLDYYRQTFLSQRHIHRIRRPLQPLPETLRRRIAAAVIS